MRLNNIQFTVDGIQQLNSRILSNSRADAKPVSYYIIEAAIKTGYINENFITNLLNKFTIGSNDATKVLWVFCPDQGKATIENVQKLISLSTGLDSDFANFNDPDSKALVGLIFKLFGVPAADVTTIEKKFKSIIDSAHKENENKQQSEQGQEPERVNNVRTGRGKTKQNDTKPTKQSKDPVASKAYDDFLKSTNKTDSEIADYKKQLGVESNEFRKAYDMLLESYMPIILLNCNEIFSEALNDIKNDNICISRSESNYLQICEAWGNAIRDKISGGANKYKQELANLKADNKSKATLLVDLIVVHLKDKLEKALVSSGIEDNDGAAVINKFADIKPGNSKQRLAIRRALKIDALSNNTRTNQIDKEVSIELFIDPNSEIKLYVPGSKSRPFFTLPRELIQGNNINQEILKQQKADQINVINNLQTELNKANSEQTAKLRVMLNRAKKTYSALTANDPIIIATNKNWGGRPAVAIINVQESSREALSHCLYKLAKESKRAKVGIQAKGNRGFVQFDNPIDAIENIGHDYYEVSK